MDLAGLLDLEPHGADTFVGVGPRYPWGGLYGGQIVAQALQAATNTVAPGLAPHSLRAYFIRAGDHTEPIRFEVDRLRNGRSYSTRRVVARQAVGAILNLEASFTGEEASADIQPLAMPDVPPPSALVEDDWSSLFERALVPVEAGTGRVQLWLRWREPVGEPRSRHVGAFAFLSDVAPSHAIRSLLLRPGQTLHDARGTFFAVSLDHTVWFHHPIQADAWHLHSFACQRFAGGRGLSLGHVFAEDGTHLATVAQEMLFRPRR